MAKAPKQSDIKAQAEMESVIHDNKDVLELSSGKTVKIGWIRPDTQDKIDQLYVEYEGNKKTIVADDPISVAKGNTMTRKFYAKTAAAFLINNYFGLKLFWWLKWRVIYHFWKLNGDDYLKIVSEAKKKAMEQSYYLAMAFLMTMPEVWTTMTRKEAEAYRQELESAKERQS